MIGEICEEQDSPLCDHYGHCETRDNQKQRSDVSDPVRSVQRKPACTSNQGTAINGPQGKMHSVRVESKCGRFVPTDISHQQNRREEKRCERPACQHKSYAREISHSQTQS